MFDSFFMFGFYFLKRLFEFFGFFPKLDDLLLMLEGLDDIFAALDSRVIGEVLAVFEGFFNL